MGAMNRFASAALLVLMISVFAMKAEAQATSLDETPIAWGEADERHTTVCDKRWHAIRIRDIRTMAIDQGLGAEAQVEQESRAIFNGGADCFTAQVIYWPLKHADVVLGARTWVQVVDRDGPVTCFKTLKCRWIVQNQNFVESTIELEGKAYPDVVYVATPRPVQPARIIEPPSAAHDEAPKRP